MTGKINILRKKSKLRKHTERIYIESDLTRKEVEIEKQIREFAKEEENRGSQIKIG